MRPMLSSLSFAIRQIFVGFGGSYWSAVNAIDSPRVLVHTIMMMLV